LNCIWRILDVYHSYAPKECGFQECDICGEQFTHNSMMGWNGEESEGVVGGDAKIVHM
jgi:hypothetical protein